MKTRAEVGPTGKQEELMILNLQLKNKKENEKKYAQFHGDSLIGNKIIPKVNTWGDVKAVFQPSNWPALGEIVDGVVKRTGLDLQSAASIVGSLSDYSANRESLINASVRDKYDKMLHPPLTYLGDAFQYRSADGKFNSAINPHLGQAGAPYAKTVPSKTAPLGALPDPSDLFDKLMARQKGGRESESGLSAMLIYHATIIIHDIFRTNDDDKNISDSSSYLDLSPLYGYTAEMQRKVRDDKYKLGLLKPDTFAEDRLLRQPPGVCIMLVMYNRYHNYAARQLLRINENGRFKVPEMYAKTQLVSLVKELLPDRDASGKKTPLDEKTMKKCAEYEKIWRQAQAEKPREAPEALTKQPEETAEEKIERKESEKQRQAALEAIAKYEKSETKQRLDHLEDDLQARLDNKKQSLRHKSEKDALEFEKKCTEFKAAWEAAWNKQDDDLFNTARLITCGMYIQISVHDYLRALMGFHQFDTNFTLDPRGDFDQKKTSRGIGNQVTVEFNLLYRFHCAIPLRDEQYTEQFMKEVLKIKNPSDTSLSDFLQTMAMAKQKVIEDRKRGVKAPEPWEVTFGIPDSPASAPPVNEGNRHRSDSGISMNVSAEAETPMKSGQAQGAPQVSRHFARNPITNLFDDGQMLDELTTSMDQPISNFGPRNVPKCLKAVEIMGILQARKWEIGTLNDFREFFELPRHTSFESVTKNIEIQNALRDLYENVDKIELYPGIFCESDERMGLDPGPSESSSALWSAIFSDAITLVRSDRFYTVDWNTNSLTSWGMKEVTPNNSICKSSVFHRLLQRAFPGWFPNDTIRFFHPFYTAKQNAIYAEAQGYGHQFRETTPSKSSTLLNPDVIVDPLEKPSKPFYIDNLNDISVVLQGDACKNFANPVYCYEANLPDIVKSVLGARQPQKPISFNPNTLESYIKDAEPQLKNYLVDLMSYINKRESISMSDTKFQIDVTRDFAIPVVTRYVAAFLGFGNKLSETATNARDTYSENEMYQHVTNCQVFLAYNTDETKWMERRQAFQTSMQTLIDLTEKGTIWEVNQWGFSKTLFGKEESNPMHELGIFVAKHVLNYEKDQSKAAAILLLICLDIAYNAVVSFTATLDGYIAGLYKAAHTEGSAQAEPEWIKIQQYALDDKDDKLEDMIEQMVQRKVHLPLVRKAIAKGTYPFEGGAKEIRKGQTVILDIANAIAKAEAGDNGYNVMKKRDEMLFLSSQLSIADKYSVFSPRRFTTLSLTSMIKFVAQMRNLRRGHDAQGKIKRIRLDSTVEGYANYMAPMRVSWIKEQIKSLDPGDAKRILTKHILKPEADTYLTPTWDEFVPFPMTWKIHYDGFGKSSYNKDGNRYGKVRSTAVIPDYCPPWYQPRGPSNIGGSFATIACVCAGNADGKDGDGTGHEHDCRCLGHSKEALHPRTTQLSSGCNIAP